MADIYALCDVSGAVRYIGKANRPEERLKRHMREARHGRRRAPLYSWLRKHGEPVLRILEVDCADWAASERRHIAQHRATGARLLNVADGGDEPHCPLEVRRANGMRLAQRLRADPVFARVRYLKVSMGHRLRRGEVDDAAREKLRYAGRRWPPLFGEYANLPNADGTPCGY